MFSRTRVLGPRLTMFCLAFLLANCGPEESADTLHCIDNYVINAKLGETPIVPNLCSGATTALEQIWTSKYDVIVKMQPTNAQPMVADVTGGKQYKVKQTVDAEATEKFTFTVMKPGSECKDSLGQPIVCSVDVSFSVIFSKDGGLSVTIDGAPPSGIIPPTAPMVTLKAMPTGAMAPTYKWERTKLIQTLPATFEMVSTDPEVDAAGLGADSYLYRVVVSDGMRSATAATVLRPQAFDASVVLVDYNEYPTTPFVFRARSAVAAHYVFKVEEATKCGGIAPAREQLATLASSPDALVDCEWKSGPASASTQSPAEIYIEAHSSDFLAGDFDIDHEGLFRVVIVIVGDSGEGQVTVDRAFFRTYHR